MNILFWNTIDFWIPSYVFNDDSYLVWKNIPYFLLVFLAMFTCSWLCFYMIVVMCEVKKFHGNATYLLASIYASWFESLIGTLLIMPYKYGLVNVADPGRIFEGFENTEDYLRMDGITLKCFPLIIGTFLGWHYLGVVNSAFSCFILERTWATLLFKDYESARRKKLSIFLIFIHQFYAFLIATVMCFHVFPLSKLLLMNASGLLFIIPYLFWLRYYNMRVRDSMRHGNNITRNSLTAKFQTAENVRSLNLASRILIIMSFLDIFFLLVIGLALFKVPGERYYYQAAEHIIFFGPLFLVPAVVSSVEDWKNRFLFYIPINKIRISPENSDDLYQVSTVQKQDSAAIHFMQLQSLWV